MSTVNLWTTASETLQAFGAHYVPTMDQAAAELGLPEWYGLLSLLERYSPSTSWNTGPQTGQIHYLLRDNHIGGCPTQRPGILPG